MAPGHIESIPECATWLEQQITIAGARLTTHDHQLVVQDDVDINGDPVALRVPSQPEQVFEFWDRPLAVKFDLVIESLNFTIRQYHFALLDTRREGAGRVVARYCCSESIYGPMLGCACHYHDGADGERQPRPDLDDVDFDGVLAEIATHPLPPPPPGYVGVTL